MNPERLYKYIKVTNLIAIIAAIISLFFMYREIVCHFIIIEMLLKNIPMMVYLKRKKNSSGYTEDYLIPQWFKDNFYHYMKSKAELRAVILFLFIPLFYVVPLPFGTCVIFLYIFPVSLLITVYFGVKWIKQGSDESIQ